MGRYIDAEGWMATGSGYGPRAYRAFVPHPLAGWAPVLSAADLSAATAADRALAAADALSHSGLGGAVADWMMARDESIRSSVIEGVAATESGLAWARYMDLAGRPVTEENEALTLGSAKQTAAAVDLGARMRAGGASSMDDILDIHMRLFDGTREQAIGGVLRDSPIWIGPPGCSVDEASFVPPPPDRLAALLEDLVVYLNGSGHPPVLRAAVAHAQFETIHPFEDGNGRTGRALIHTVLNASGAARGTLPISTALSDDRRSYYDALNATRVVCAADDTARSAALSRWLRFFAYSCEAAHRQAASAARNAEAMTARWRQAGGFRSDSAAAALLEALPSMPVLDAETASERLGISRRAARDALSSLEAAGIVSRTGGQRNRRFLVPDMVGTLRRMAPDSGLPGRSGIPSAPAPPAQRQTPSEPTACGFLGTRSKKRCQLPQGHAGQHRYTLP